MAEQKFENALKELEEIVDRLESGDFSLDESLAKYEEGVKLIRFCQKKLEQAKKKIEILVKTKDGKIKIEPFERESARSGRNEK
ncbi:MAG: exodeoxyribonuclease VII small subunit [Candidatus Omnitrophota bacterium]